MNIHPNARTTPRIRKEIQQSSEGVCELARRYNVQRHTVRKWKRRKDSQDRSHRPHTLHTTLSPLQEYIVVSLRETLLLPLDDLVAITKEYIHPEASRSGIHRLLQREGLSNLRALQAALSPEEDKQPKTFKDYEPGYVHIDIKYLPQMPDEDHHRYLFVAIDRATRWVYLEIHGDKTAATAAAFLGRMNDKAAFRTTIVLTDNGKEFTDRFTANGKRQPTGKHAFDKTCQAKGIEHRLIKPKHPQTNGMVERFNGRIADILKTTVFANAEELEKTLMKYGKLYNHQIHQKALNHKTPIQTMKDWYKKKPELFKKRVYNQTGPDSYHLQAPKETMLVQ